MYINKLTIFAKDVSYYDWLSNTDVNINFGDSDFSNKFIIPTFTLLLITSINHLAPKNKFYTEYEAKCWQSTLTSDDKYTSITISKCFNKSEVKEALVNALEFFVKVNFTFSETQVEYEKCYKENKDTLIAIANELMTILQQDNYSYYWNSVDGMN